MGLLRFILAFSVVNVHGNLLGMNLIFADIAVQSFYVISGFYMAMILNEKYNRHDITYFDFLMSRFFRIAPAYFLVTLLTFIVALIAWFGFAARIPPLQYWQELFNRMSIFSIFSVVVPQFSLLGLDIVNFFTLDLSGNFAFTDQFTKEPTKLWRLLAVPQGWTLALEFYFYMLAPFIVRRSIPFLFSLVVASFIVRLALATLLDFRLDPWTYRFFPSELMFFLCGSLAYRLSTDLKPDGARVDTYLLAGFCSLLIVVAGMIGRYGHEGGNIYFYSPIFIGILFLILPKLFTLTKNIKLDRYIGELSYPLYISHMLVIWVVSLMMVQGSLPQRIAIGLGSILFSILIYELLDRRIDAFRHRTFAKEVENE